MTTPTDTLLFCARAGTVEPRVPSVEQTCDQCGHALIVSIDLLSEEVIADARILCVEHQSEYPGEVRVTDSQRAFLVDLGIDDAQIDRVIKYLNDPDNKETP
jgi:hypothetical protein